MKTNQLYLTNGWIQIASALLLFFFWLLFAIFLPMKNAYVDWVLDKDWVWINTIGYFGSLLGVFAITGIHQYVKKKNTFEFLSYFSAITGIVALTSLLFFEAFILKGLAKQSPEIIRLNEGFYAELPFFVVNLTGGILFSLGIVGLCFSMIRYRTFKRWKLLLLIAGAPMFGIVLMPGNIRLLGVLCYIIGFTGIGIEMKRKQGKIGHT